MGEMIGKVYLDTTYYPGKDLYSDGAIEDEMLAIARDYTPQEFNSVIREKESWPILYHFSHIRENILGWLPFTGEEKVLEVGAGCGAVTGVLCRKAKEVTSIDLSMKRSRINAYRHKDQDNLKILVGNFQEIEQNLTEKYDYITLIGVFEYGEAYIQSEDPYVDFLKIISRHLKPDGKIILAIENRLGLKYWAGCTEDHFGTLFEGIEGYPRTSGVKTFTKKEFGKILKSAGDLKASWYYPFPDYKFPMTVYSDGYLPAKGELNRTEYNFDRFRLQLFQESFVYDTLLDNDLYPQFANSFLLLIGREQPEIKTLYAKFSNERDRHFDIRTEISGTESGEKTVRKYPETEEASEHISRLEKISLNLSELYKEFGISVNKCKGGKNYAEFEFLNGITLEEKLDTLLKEGKTDQAEELLFTYTDMVKKIHEREEFYKTEDFVRVFGNVRLKPGLKCAAISNIDLVPANIILEQGRASVIDYEWTFSFPVPSQFIVYRMIHYYLESDGKREVLRQRNLYEKAGLTEEDCKVFAEMERNFQQYMLGSHASMLSLYRRISPGKADAVIFYEEKKKEAAQKLQIFLDTGSGFSEENSVKFPIKDRRCIVKMELPGRIQSLRLDPGELRTGIRVCRIHWEDGTSAQFCTNGVSLGENLYYFGAADPQIQIQRIPENVGTIEIELEFEDEKETSEKFWNIYQKREQNFRIRETELQKQENVLRTVENSKLWKMYRNVKKV